MLDPVPRPIDHLPSMGQPGDVAIADRLGVLNYAQLEDAVAKLAGWLARLGLQPGDRVAGWLPKNRTACLLPLAAPRAGLIHVPINPLLKHPQVAYILSDSGAALLITQSGRAETLGPDDVPQGCAIQLDQADWGNDVIGQSSAATDALAAILYTSGSTGQPKGVMLSHANLWLGAISVAHYLKLSPADRTLCVLPFGFDYGQNQLFSSWAAGARVIPLDYLVARDVMKAVERYGVTTLAGVPPLWTQLLEIDWPIEAASQLRRVTNSGGALTRSMVRGLRSTFPAADVYPMYGITEAFRSTYLAPELVDDHPESMGRAIPFAEVMVVRADGSRAAPDEAGELVHAGPLVSKGYWRDEGRMAGRYRAAPDYFEMGGMAVFSGDIVTQGADGLFRFIARSDEMIKSAGNRISPTEIEEAVMAGGEVVEVMAMGIPDPRLGQAILVVARAKGDPHQAEVAVRLRLRELLPNFMQPGRYEWRDALPHNANGKIDRAMLKGEYAV